MSIINVRDRKLGSDDVAWGVGSYTYTDANGVTRTTPEINASVIPVTATQNVFEGLLDITAVAADAAELSNALTDMGSSYGTIYLRRGTYTFGAGFVSPSNVRLWAENGAVINMTGGTADINGPIIGADSQLFSWSGAGAIDLTGSPTTDIPLEWFGGLSGTSNDCSAAFAKLLASTDNHQWMVLNKGLWRLATPQVINRFVSASQWSSVKIKGQGLWFSQLYIDVGANVGLTIGVVGQETQYCELYDFAFVGPAACCTNALVVNETHHLRFRDVGFYLGATSYALHINGCLFVDGSVLVNAGTNNYSSYAKAHDGVLVTASITPYQSNVLDLHVNVEAGANHGVYLDGTNFTADVVRLSGTIEGYGGYPLQCYKQEILDLTNLYIEGAGNGILINDCNQFKLDTVLCNSATDFIQLTACRSGFLNNFHAPFLYIDQDCRSINVGTGELSEVNGLIDFAPDTVYSGTLRYRNALVPTAFMNPGHDAKNLIDNYQLDRWDSVNAIMDGYSLSGLGFLTYTQAGVGLADTTHNLTTYCAKLVLAGGDDAVVYPVPTRHLTSLHGKWMNYTINLLMKSAQTFTTYPSLEMDFTVPNRANGTAYQVGDAVLAVPDTGYQYSCVIAGTTAGAQPAMPVTPGQRVVDGGVTWACNYPGQLSTAMPCTAADIGVWKPIRVEAYCPRNCTAGNISLLLYRQTGGAAATFYMETPALMDGRHNPRGLLPGKSENPDWVVINGMKIMFDSVVPSDGASKYNGYFHRAGDVCYQIGGTGTSRCTLAGKPGTWSAF